MKAKLIYCILFVFIFGFGYSVSSLRWENKLLERETELKNEYIEKQNKIVAEKDATINLLLEEGEIYFKRTSSMLLLTGCSTISKNPLKDCPQLKVPATLTRQHSESAKSLSAEVQSYLDDVLAYSQKTQ